MFWQHFSLLRYVTVEKHQDKPDMRNDSILHQLVDCVYPWDFFFLFPLLTSISVSEKSLGKQSRSIFCHACPFTRSLWVTTLWHFEGSQLKFTQRGNVKPGPYVRGCICFRSSQLPAGERLHMHCESLAIQHMWLHAPPLECTYKMHVTASANPCAFLIYTWKCPETGSSV